MIDQREKWIVRKKKRPSRTSHWSYRILTHICNAVLPLSWSLLLPSLLHIIYHILFCWLLLSLSEYIYLYECSSLSWASRRDTKTNNSKNILTLISIYLLYSVCLRHYTLCAHCTHLYIWVICGIVYLLSLSLSLACWQSQKPWPFTFIGWENISDNID